MTEVRATSRYVRVAPNKARQVVAHIRGLPVEQAQRTLQFSPKQVAAQILKTLNSAVANADHNHDLDADDLVVTSAVVDEGPTLKRFQPRAMGRAYRVRKRTSHITITVGTADDDGRAARRPTATTAAGAPSPTGAGQTAGDRRGLRGRRGRRGDKEQ